MRESCKRGVVEFEAMGRCNRTDIECGGPRLETVAPANETDFHPCRAERAKIQFNTYHSLAR